MIDFAFGFVIASGMAFIFFIRNWKK